MCASSHSGFRCALSPSEGRSCCSTLTPSRRSQCACICALVVLCHALGRHCNVHMQCHHRPSRLNAACIKKLDPKSDGAARDWVAIYDECSRILYEEINYIMEAEYARDFAANFAGVDWVKVPEVYRDYLSPEVIVMEYVPGVKINNGAAIDDMGLDRQRLARLSVESYLQQLLRHGLFHADPHPGNVAVDAVGGGRLIYYDFGMMGRIQPSVRCALHRAIRLHRWCV
jgi:predicted unusual protein kinase regulating ubiquinone biosynthesis (AarF/ABC1/UbiB family)